MGVFRADGKGLVRMPFGKRLEGIEEKMLGKSGERAFQAEKTVSAKILRQEVVYSVQGRAKRPV